MQFHHYFIFKKDFTYIFLERGEGKERERETAMCGCLSCAPYWRPGLQPRHVPWLGIKSATLWFTGWNSIHWATPAMALLVFLNTPPLPSYPHTLLQSGNHQNALYIHDSVSVLVCSVSLDSILDKYVFIAILLFIVLTFFLNKSL